jgi:hypothetical protein
MLFLQQQQLQWQTLCNLITSGHGITPAPVPPNSQGAFAGENAVACAGLQPLIAAALLLQQCPWQPGGIVYHQQLPCHSIHVPPVCMSLIFPCTSALMP